jgi:hypothetical protein
MISLAIALQPTNEYSNPFEILRAYKIIGDNLKEINRQLKILDKSNKCYGHLLMQENTLKSIFQGLTDMLEIFLGMYEREYKIKMELIKEF